MTNTFNKVIVIGDVHGNPLWKNIVDSNHDADLFVFAGDYVSTHENYSAKEQLDNLEEILNFKENNPDKVVLLRGNHDLQHMGYYWAECSGYFRGVEREMAKDPLKSRYLADTQWLILLDNILISHAGVTQRWFDDTGCKTIEDINNLEPNELFGFRPCKMSDYYGISETQGITWVRTWTLMDYAVLGYTYIVGHTTYKHAFNFTEACRNEDLENVRENAPDIWVCDCRLEEYLVIENNKIRVEKTKK